MAVICDAMGRTWFPGLWTTWSLVVAVGYTAHPMAPGQGGIQILAAVMMADVVVLRPLVSGSHLFGASPEEYLCGFF